MKINYFIIAVFSFTFILLCVRSHELDKLLKAEREKNTELHNQYQTVISNMQVLESKKDESTKQIEYLSNDFTCTVIPDDVANWLRKL